jgi:hypothetical protein
VLTSGHQGWAAPRITNLTAVRAAGVTSPVIFSGLHMFVAAERLYALVLLSYSLAPRSA